MELNESRKATAKGQKCESLLALVEGGKPIAWYLAFRKEERSIGTGVEGPGRLLRPGVAPLHATIWMEHKVIWLQPSEYTVWLNFVPIAPKSRVSLIKGDILHLGPPPIGPQLIVTCIAEVEEANGFADEFDGSGHLDDLDVSELSPAEYEVLSWFARGETELEEIASSLFRSVNTVRTQLNQIYSKLKVHSKSELASKLLRNRDSVERQKSRLGRTLGSCHCRG